MIAVRSLLAWLRDVARSVIAPKVAPGWSKLADNLERQADAAEQLAASWALSQFEEMRRKDPLVRQLADAVGLNDLGSAVVDPDSVGPAHRASDVRPLDLTACGLDRRRFGWTMALCNVPRDQRCPTCFPTRVETP